ncbi:11868_t:CDS:2 [Funneliformis geosporum]|nr:11868_t:CDS:2 [Funneliformis geosporum]
MSLPYNLRQSCFTSYSNFQEFIDTKKVFCKYGKIITFGNIYQKNFQKNTSFTRKKLSKKEQKEFERTLESEATWRLNKEVLAIYHMQCEKRTNNKSTICNKYEGLKSNKHLNEAFKVMSFNAFTFDGNGTFIKLVALMIQIKEKKLQAFARLLVQRIRQIRRTDFIIITNPDLVIENFMKFSQIVSKLNYIAGSILPCSEITINILEDVHLKINYILEKMQLLHKSAVLIGKVLPMIIAMIPIKGNEEAEQIAHLIRQVFEMAHIANLNVLSFGTRSEFNA